MLGKTVLDAGHAVAASALSGAALAEVQAEFHLRKALSEFQINDFDLRKRAMESIGQTYAWSEFQRDIQRLHNADAGWQQSWWSEKLTSLGGERLSVFQVNLLGWFNAAKAEPLRSFPLGAYDPHPQKSLLSAWLEQQLHHPQPAKPIGITGHAAVSISQIAHPTWDRIWNHGEKNWPLPCGDTSFGSRL
ncbi:hypothetical protein [Rhodoferax sp.]|uniref:hypothetical protein n=1 Tax=Rhodoferax sp. TaxID=50421 RepID=UPI003783F672